MNVWISAEIDMDAISNFNQLRIKIESALNSALTCSELANLDLHIRYVPVVMSEAMSKEYPARSKFRGRTLLSAPQIDHGVFASSNCELDRVRVFFAGLRNDLDLIPMDAWGAEERTIFENILNHIEKTIIREFRRNGDAKEHM